MPVLVMLSAILMALLLSAFTALLPTLAAVWLWSIYAPLYHLPAVPWWHFWLLLFILASVFKSSSSSSK